VTAALAAVTGLGARHAIRLGDGDDDEACVAGARALVERGYQ